jgi:hypothetical protein
MAEPAAATTNGAPASAPQSPAGVAQPAPQPPKRMRISDMQEGLEQHNALADQRARETEQRLARPDPRQQAQPTPEPEAQPEAEGELLPQDDAEQPPAVDPRALQEQDQQLLEATKAWLEGGETPEAFKNVIHEWTDKTTGAPRRMTIAQMEEGVLRQSDYQRNMNELRGYHQQVQFREQAATRLEQAFGDPERLYAELQRRDPKVFHQVSVKYATERAQMKRNAEGAGYALMQQFGYQSNHPDVINAVRQSMQAQEAKQRVEIENQILREHNQMLSQVRQQQEGQQQRQVRLQELGESIKPLITPSLKSVDVRNTATNQQAFWKHLASYVTNLPNWDGNVRRSHCVEAAKMVREELDDERAARAPKRPAPQSRSMPPSNLSSSGSAKTQQPERKRISDMASDPRFSFGVG